MPLAECLEGKIFIPALVAKDFEIKEEVAPQSTVTWTGKWL